MSQRDFDAEIASKEAELVACKTKMVEHADELMSAVAARLSTWYHEQAAEHARREPDVTLAAAPGQIAAMKAEVAKLAESAAAIVERHLNREDILWHKSEKPLSTQKHGSTPYGSGDNMIPHVLVEPIRAAQSELLRIVRKYGYQKSQPSSTTWQGSEGAAVIYSMPYPIPDVPEIAHQYSKEYDKARNVRGAITQIQSDKTVAAAQRIWDSA